MDAIEARTAGGRSFNGFRRPWSSTSADVAEPNAPDFLERRHRGQFRLCELPRLAGGNGRSHVNIGQQPRPLVFGGFGTVPGADGGLRGVEILQVFAGKSLLFRGQRHVQDFR